MINLPLMNDNITRDDVNVLIDFLQNNNIFTQNKNVREFEKEWSEWLGVKYSIREFGIIGKLHYNGGAGGNVWKG